MSHEAHISLQQGYQGREATAVILHAERLGIPYTTDIDPRPGSVLVGTVEWCEKAIPYIPANPYPSNLHHLLHRPVHLINNAHGLTLSDPTFVKDASAWKTNWQSAVYPAGTTIHIEAAYLSPPISFTQEWRYYLADGSVLSTGWYAGHDEDEPAPPLPYTPIGFSGTIDMGRLADGIHEDGPLALVEAHAPYACSWYADSLEDFVTWQVLAWEHLWTWLHPSKANREQWRHHCELT